MYFWRSWPKINEKMNWGIVGLGNIARSFLEDMRLLKDQQVLACASRSISNAEFFAKDYSIPKYYGKYNELFDVEEVDIVYIATTHDTHAQLSIEAMEKGKHVLCEKPMAVNSNDAKKMIAAAQHNGVFLMEAFWSRFNPSIRSVLEHIINGDIGDVKYINADFTFLGVERAKDRLLNPNLAGGALLDIGVYPLFLAYVVLGLPSEICSTDILLSLIHI